MSKEINVPVVVIGAGPKGLATAVALQEYYGTEDIPILEGKRPGGNWTHDTLNPSRKMHPAGWEIVSDPERTFEAFATQNDHFRDPDSRPTFAQYGSYLRWLSKTTKVVNTKAETLLQTSKGLRVKADGTIFTAKAVVLTTGLNGMGNGEFTHDPTGLRPNSELVVHTPTDIRTRKETLDFIGDAKTVAVIGAGVAGSFAIDDLTYSSVNTIHHIGAEGFSVNDTSPWMSKNNPVSSTLSYNAQRATLLGDRLNTHIGTKITAARETDNGVILITHDNRQIPVDKVILATGYKYDISKLPFLAALISAGRIKIHGRYPEIDQNYRLASEPVLYGHGEIAVTRGAGQRFLASTIPTLSIMVPALLAEINHPEI